MTEVVAPSSENDQRGHPAVLIVVCSALFGGSFGATLFSSIVIKTGPDADADAFNPLHSGDGAEFSNAFTALLVPIAIGLALSAVLPRKQPTDDTPAVESTWTHDCQVPWAPELEPELATATTGATSND